MILLAALAMLVAGGGCGTDRSATVESVAGESAEEDVGRVDDEPGDFCAAVAQEKAVRDQQLIELDAPPPEWAREARRISVTMHENLLELAPEELRGDLAELVRNGRILMEEDAPLPNQDALSAIGEHLRSFANLVNEHCGTQFAPGDLS